MKITEIYPADEKGKTKIILEETVSSDFMLKNNPKIGDYLSQQSQQPDSKDLEVLKEDFKSKFADDNTFLTKWGNEFYHDPDKIFNFFSCCISPQSKPVVDTEGLRNKFYTKFLKDFGGNIAARPRERSNQIVDWLISNLTNTSEGDKWISVNEKTPLCYMSGHWDGLKSDVVLVYSNGITLPATAYEGFLDGSKYLNFYDYRDCEISSPTYWQPLPSPPINK